MLEKNIFVNFKRIFLFLLIALFIYYLFESLLIYKFFVLPVVIKNQANIFIDWNAITSAIDCSKKGFDVFIENPCDVIGRRHVYGSILLNIPLSNNFFFFNNFVLPILINLTLILIVTFFFRFEKKNEYFLWFLLIINPSTLLIIERANVDLIILLLLVLACYIWKDIIKIPIILIISFIKFYPIICSLIYFFEEKFLKKNIYKFLLLFFFVSIGLFLDLDNIIKIVQNQEQFTAGYKYSFSFSSLSLVPQFQNYFNQKILLIFTLILFLIFYYLNFTQLKKVLLNFTPDSFEKRLFLIGSLILVSTFFIFKNIYYREIFIVLIIPYIIRSNENYYKFLINFLIFKYIIFILAMYFSFFTFEYQNDILLIIKFFMDLFLISFLLSALTKIFFFKTNIKVAINN